jgi:hypothetical protein
MFVYEREKDSSLVVGAGIPDEWVSDSAGVHAANLPTYYGTISIDLRKLGTRVTVALSGDIRMPPGKVHLISPLSRMFKSAALGAKRARTSASHEVIIDRLPATVEFRY